MKAVPWVALAVVALVACGKREVSDTRPEASRTAATASLNAPAVAQDVGSFGIAGGRVADEVRPGASVSLPESATDSVAPGMIIRTGQASIEIDKLDPALVKIKALAAQLGGYVANSSFSGGRDQVRSATLELKIPAEKYDAATTSLSGIGKLESINTSAADVGEEYADVNARVANSHRLEDRLVNLLATRTGKLEDVLAVERELARVREEIERYEGRMRFLKAHSAMSTLTVTIHEPLPILGRTPGEDPVSAAVRQAWRNFVALVAGFIASLGILIPVGLVAGGVWYFYRRHRAHRVA